MCCIRKHQRGVGLSKKILDSPSFNQIQMPLAWRYFDAIRAGTTPSTASWHGCLDIKPNDVIPGRSSWVRTIGHLLMVPVALHIGWNSDLLEPPAQPTCLRDPTPGMVVARYQIQGPSRLISAFNQARLAMVHGKRGS